METAIYFSYILVWFFLYSPSYVFFPTSIRLSAKDIELEVGKPNTIPKGQCLDDITQPGPKPSIPGRHAVLPLHSGWNFGDMQAPSWGTQDFLLSSPPPSHMIGLALSPLWAIFLHNGINETPVGFQIVLDLCQIWNPDFHNMLTMHTTLTTQMPWIPSFGAEQQGRPPPLPRKAHCCPQTDSPSHQIFIDSMFKEPGTGAHDDRKYPFLAYLFLLVMVDPDSVYSFVWTDSHKYAVL